MKNKGAKKTVVSKGRPQTDEERQALMQPGKAPTMFAYLNIPHGFPPKKKAVPSSNTNSNESANTADSIIVVALLKKKTQGLYAHWNKGEHKAAKMPVIQSLASCQGEGYIAAASKPTIKFTQL